MTSSRANACPARCPGCAHRTRSRVESESQKQAWLEHKLAPWAKVLQPLRGAPEELRWDYRAKTCLRAEWAAGEWKFGLLVGSKNRGDAELIAIHDCPVHTPKIRKITQTLASRLPGPDVLPLAFLVVSGGLVVLVLKAREFRAQAALEPLFPLFGEAGLALDGVLVNLNPSAGERVFSMRAWQQLWGRAESELSALGRKFRHGPTSFQQLIPTLFGRALEEARDFLAPGPGDGVVDLCSGIGVSLPLWQERGARVAAVELGGEAIRLAEANAPGALCLRGRASDRIPQLEEFVQRWEPAHRLVFANPPRLGLEAEVVEWLARSAQPARIAYLSCSAGTLARDLSLLEKAGYAVRRITPYDFFPQTHHVETLALLDRAAALRGGDAPARGDDRAHG